MSCASCERRKRWLLTRWERACRWVRSVVGSVRFGMDNANTTNISNTTTIEGGTPCGTDNEVQFRGTNASNYGIFDCYSGFTFDKTNKILKLDVDPLLIRAVTAPASVALGEDNQITDLGSGAKRGYAFGTSNIIIQSAGTVSANMAIGNGNQITSTPDVDQNIAIGQSNFMQTPGFNGGYNIAIGRAHFVGATNLHDVITIGLSVLASGGSTPTTVSQDIRIGTKQSNLHQMLVVRQSTGEVLIDDALIVGGAVTVGSISTLTVTTATNFLVHNDEVVTHNDDLVFKL